MRILIYESLPDIKRSAFVRQLRKYLRRFGHEVYCLADAQTDFQLNHGQGEPGRINCIAPLCHNIIRNNRYSTFVYTPKKNISSPHGSRLRQEFYAKILNLIEPDCIVVWSGLASHHVDFMNLIYAMNLTHKLNYLETGWLPQKEYIYCDSEGINGNSSIASQKLSSLSKKQNSQLSDWLSKFRGDISLAKNPQTILIPLQIEEDTSILHFSPFKTMQSFLSFLEGWIPTGYNVTIRPHPKSTKSTPSISRDDFIIDECKSLYELLASSETVIAINSTTLIEAMAFGCKALAFGQGVFSCLENVCVKKELNFVDAISKNQDVSPLLYDLIFRRQISVHTLDGLESCLTGISSQKHFISGVPYSFLKLIYGESRYWVGKALKRIGALS